MSQISLVRLPISQWSYGQALAPTRHCRLDPCSKQHAAAVDDAGVLFYYHVDADHKAITELFSCQLRFRPHDAASLEAIRSHWSFEFVPGSPGELLLVQPGSSRILYTSLPHQGDGSSDVFLFGTHTAPVTTFTTNGTIALSGCASGTIKLWRLLDGQLADTVAQPSTVAVTALECLGPLMVACGTSVGTVTVYDIASGRMLAVQRFSAGSGPISCMTSWMELELFSKCSLAAPGPRVPDGGGVLPGPNIGCPWREEFRQQRQQQKGSEQPQGAHSSPALLAAASTAGWLHVYEARLPGCNSWHLLHSSDSLAAPISALAFSPRGDTLAVAGPSARIVGMDAATVAVAGVQLGAVGLYHISCNSSSIAGLETAQGCNRPDAATHCHQQQQQLSSLHLWHQWSLRSVPVGLAVLPSSRLELLDGRQLAAVQVLDLLVAPELGPSIVLTASQPLGSPSLPDSSSSAQTTPQQHLQHQHQQQQSQLRSSVDACATLQAVAEHCFDDSNLAERDLSAVVDAIADAGTLSESELAALLHDLETIRQEVAAAPASAAAEVLHVNADEQGQQGAPGQLLQSLDQQQHSGCEQQSSGKVEAATGQLSSASVQSAKSSAATAEVVAGSINASGVGAGSTGSTGAGVSLQRPTTLPTLRSWMDRQAAVAAGIAAGTTAEPLSLEAFAEEMLQQQQQHETEEQQAIQAAGQEVGELGQDLEEQELPCESSFQQLLQEQEGLQQDWQQRQQDIELKQHIEQEHLEQHEAERLQQQYTMKPTAAGKQQSMAVMQLPPHAYPSQQQAMAGASPQQEQQEKHNVCHHSSSTARSSAQHAGHDCPADAGASSTGVDSNEIDVEAEPLPRQLPIALQGRHTQLQKVQPQLQRQPQQQLPQPHVSKVQLPGSGSDSPALGAAVEAGQVRSKQAAAVAAADASWTFRAAPAAVHKFQQQSLEPHWQQQQQQSHSTAARMLADIDARGQQEIHRRGEEAQQQMQSLQQRQQRQQQQQQPKQRQRPAQAQGGRLAQGLRLRQQQQQPETTGSSTAAADAVMPASDHPLATAVANSSLLLAQKIQEAAQPPTVAVDPDGPTITKLAAKLTDLDFDRDQQQYHGLQDLKDIPTPRKVHKVVSKQLDARWVASRSMKPQLDTLFRPEDWQPGYVNPQTLVLPYWPTPQQVVQKLMWPQRCR